VTTPPEPLRISCRLEVLPGETVIEQLHAAHRFGFGGVALPGRFMERWLKPLHECFQDSPLPMAALSIGFRKSLLSPAPSDRQTCRDDLLKLFDLCAEFDVNTFNLPPCLIQDNPVRIHAADGFGSVRERLDALLLEQLPALGDEAEQRGVELLIEPVNQYESDYLNSVEHAAALCRRLDHPAVGFTADFFHMQIEELHTPDAIRATGAPTRSGRFPLRHVHVAENTRVEPGPGSLNLLPGFRALKDVGYPGWIELECRHLSGLATEVLPRSVEYMRETWARA
jgi:sugar phosphate isomerase/epimerase